MRYNTITKKDQSFASMIPPSEISKVASFSAKHGESNILHILC